MFGFSKKSMKLGRVKKVHLSDSISTPGARNPIRPPKRAHNSSVHCDDQLDCECQKSAHPAADIGSSTSGNSNNWMVLSIAGDKPAPRFNHAATVIGNKMVVVGGESGSGLLDDVQVLKFDQFTWTTIPSKLYHSPSSLPLKIPACKGHCLLCWLIPLVWVVPVWAFDTERECWSVMEARGDIPIARSGHTVVRSGSILILFGGEDAKKRKLNDLHMFDLKSLLWVPFCSTGARPSARSNHVAALCDRKTLLIFGGASKSRTLNDLYSLDFGSMVWSMINIRGFHPSPRAGCCGVLCGTKWYIAGGGNGKKRHSETLIFDVSKVEWSVAFASPSSSITTKKARSQGFSLVLMQHKEKDFLVAFGGSRKEPSNQVEVMELDKHESSMSRRSGKGPLGVSQRSVDSVARQNLASAAEHGSGRNSVSESSIMDSGCASGNVSHTKKFHEEEHNRVFEMVKRSEEGNVSSPGNEQQMNQSNTPIQPYYNQLGKIISEDKSCVYGSSSDLIVDNEGVVIPETADFPSRGPHSSVYQLYESKISALIKKNGVLEGQLAAALDCREVAEKSFSAVVKSKQDVEQKLVDASREVELLKEKMAGLEMAHEEANSMSNIIHSDNLRLEHDVAFIKAIFEDTQKELHSTRGVLAAEKARAFQLQVEVFHLKQRLQSLENRAPKSES
ncbi:unnamed protein product [Linum tenue]|uniref:Acyl-CoA-binding domain-containing protein n=1 Tax=Linum tenue TaxID=586396 RepID=A0AAV0S525_9ROSI|nr:unnamed protein product [Linum tenue]